MDYHIKLMAIGQNRREVEIPLKIFNFSGGEVQVRIEDIESSVFVDAKYYRINALLTSSDEVMALMMLKNALDNLTDKLIYLNLPYFPYARQDRVVYKGEALASKMMADMINHMNFRMVTIDDIHSHVSKDFLKNTIIRTAKNIFDANNILQQGEYVIAPDHGALERASSCARDDRLIICEKTRNPDNGKLSGFHVVSGLPENRDIDAIIVDDICDGGGTFLGLADTLREHIDGQLRLYVTHGIFSQGFEKLLGVFDEIIVTNMLYRGPVPERVTVLEQKFENHPKLSSSSPSP